jgi:hypothetical protein
MFHVFTPLNTYSLHYPGITSTSDRSCDQATDIAIFTLHADVSCFTTPQILSPAGSDVEKTWYMQVVRVYLGTYNPTISSHTAIAAIVTPEVIQVKECDVHLLHPIKTITVKQSIRGTTRREKCLVRHQKNLHPGRRDTFHSPTQQ